MASLALKKKKNGQRVNTPHRLHARTHIAVNRGKMNIKCRPCMVVGEIRVGYTSSYAYLLGHLHEIEMSWISRRILSTHITFINCCDKRHMFVRTLYSSRFASNMLAPSYDLIVLHDIVGFLLASLHTHTHTQQHCDKTIWVICINLHVKQFPFQHIINCQGNWFHNRALSPLSAKRGWCFVVVFMNNT